MLPMERHVPEPLKQLRQKQAAEAKLLAAQHRQRSGVLKDHAKIREAQATEKAPNVERLKTPPSADPNGNAASNQEQMPNQATTSTRLPDSQETGDTAPKGHTRTLTEDPKILPEASGTP